MAVERGILFLVVGPSGAGKDTLIDAARDSLGEQGQFVFPVRHITRAIDAGGEAHHPLDQATFLTNVERGSYAFHWQAHGLCYGIPKHILGDLENNRHVVVNVSRSILDKARQIVSPLIILAIHVPDNILRARLKARGRENNRDIEARVQRASKYDVQGVDVISFSNDRPIAEATRLLIQTLSDCVEKESEQVT
ncbi:MAG: phosphonate metabolism protein/1,5-bisphosphokinase (PRPP-forming) PhnN [Pseudomonadota bacterium]